jgi:UDP-3-O-[3-hydroxymyristoyl] glucosamine N-acyltransferase
MGATITLQELAGLVGGKLVRGDAATAITGINSLQEAVAGEATFLGNSRYLKALQETGASAALVPPGFSERVPDGVALITVENPTLAFSSVIKFFSPKPRQIKMGVHPSAVVSPTAVLDRSKVSVGPCVVIEDGAVIGDGTVIHAGAFVGADVRIGAACLLHSGSIVKDHCVIGSRVTIHSGAVIGTDGFGFELVNGRHQKIEQMGIVQIDDDVEIGSCSTIDRARFGRTWIGEGTKIDNLVQIGHNVVIGKHCILCAQTGISGSTKLGNYVVMGGQVGVAGHLKIGNQVTFLAKSGVAKDYPEAGSYTGYPAKPLMEGRRMLAAPAKVPELLDRVRELEKKIEALEKLRDR